MRRLAPLMVLSAAFYFLLAFGSSVYGSYRYEPSGVQYFIPPLFSVFAALLGMAFALWARRLRAPWYLTVLWVPGVALLALPLFGMPLTNIALERARWATAAAAIVHAVVFAAYVLRRWNAESSAPAA